MIQLSTDDCHHVIVETYMNRGGVELLRSVLQLAVPDDSERDDKPGPGNPNESSQWCKCGKCRPMPTPRDNVCCRQRPCITTTEAFSSNVLIPIFCRSPL